MPLARRKIPRKREKKKPKRQSVFKKGQTVEIIAGKHASLGETTVKGRLIQVRNNKVTIEIVVQKMVAREKSTRRDIFLRAGEKLPTVTHRVNKKKFVEVDVSEIKIPEPSDTRSKFTKPSRKAIELRTKLDEVAREIRVLERQSKYKGKKVSKRIATYKGKKVSKRTAARLVRELKQRVRKLTEKPRNQQKTKIVRVKGKIKILETRLRMLKILKDDLESPQADLKSNKAERYKIGEKRQKTVANLNILKHWLDELNRKT